MDGDVFDLNVMMAEGIDGLLRVIENVITLLICRGSRRRRGIMAISSRAPSSSSPKHCMNCSRPSQVFVRYEGLG